MKENKKNYNNKRFSFSYSYWNMLETLQKKRSNTRGWAICWFAPCVGLTLIPLHRMQTWSLNQTAQVVPMFFLRKLLTKVVIIYVLQISPLCWSTGNLACSTISHHCATAKKGTTVPPAKLPITPPLRRSARDPATPEPPRLPPNPTTCRTHKTPHILHAMTIGHQPHANKSI